MNMKKYCDTERQWAIMFLCNRMYSESTPAILLMILYNEM